MKWVFPALNASCVRGSGKVVAGRVDVYECDYGRFLIRYEQWERGWDKYAYFNAINPEFRSGVWHASKEFAGRTWTSVAQDSTDSKPYKRSAAYLERPFSFEVDGVDPTSRLEGIKIAEAGTRAPNSIGRG